MHSLTNGLLLIASGFLVGGFILINKYAAEPMQVGEQTVTQKHLYMGLFIIGLPMLWWSNPFSLFFWLVGSSLLLVLGHASFIEPPVSSEYTGVEQV